MEQDNQKTISRINEAIITLREDNLLKQQDANVEVNAPLALMQVSLKAEIRGLQIALKIIKETSPEPKPGESEDCPVELTYSALSCEEGLKLLKSLFSSFYIERGEEEEKNLEVKLCTYAHGTLIELWFTDFFDEYLCGYSNVDGTGQSTMPDNWQLILNTPRLVEWEGKKQWVKFLPNGFTQ